MKVLLNPQPLLSPSHSISPQKPRNFTLFQAQPCPKYRRRWIGRRCLSSSPMAVLDSDTVEKPGVPEFDLRNPSLSSSYRSPALPKPNQTVLEAQTRVCTGPTQTRPLDEQQAFKVFETILQSGSYFFHLI